MRIVLVHPQIPQNCGNVVRLCAATGCSLVLVRPLGFSITDSRLKRAGLDYWLGVDVLILESVDELIEQMPEQVFFFSSKAEKSYWQVSYPEDCWLIFGSEVSGLPDPLHQLYQDKFVTIPMVGGCRCLNLANSCAIGVYEAIRQRTI